MHSKLHILESIFKDISFDFMFINFQSKSPGND